MLEGSWRVSDETSIRSSHPYLHDLGVSPVPNGEPMTHLIQHKVRGELAFDIAERCCATGGKEPCQPDCGNWNGEKCLCAEEWIIPTSGHRAYPFKTWPLTELIGLVTERVPDEWPDHYNVVEERAVAKKGMGLDIWSIISRPEPKLVRRRV